MRIRFVSSKVLNSIQHKIKTSADCNEHKTDALSCQPDVDNDEQRTICRLYLEKLIDECRFNHPERVKTFFAKTILQSLYRQSRSSSSVRFHRFVSQALLHLNPQATKPPWYDCCLTELMKIYNNGQDVSSRIANVARQMVEINRKLRETNTHDPNHKSSFY